MNGLFFQRTKPKFRIALFAAVLLGLVLAIHHTHAQSPKSKPYRNHSLNKFLQLFDANGDGKVTLAEFKQAALKRFAAIDRNGDRKIDPKELADYLKSRRNEWRLKRMKIIDTNGDKKISLQEYLTYKEARAKRRFNRIDRNHNGFIEVDELLSYRAHRLSKRGGYRGFSQRLFKKLDLNKDGKISQSESLEAWSRWFNKLDRNKDRVITGADDHR